MQITFLYVRYSCKPTSHNEFALAWVRLHRALGHALCKGLGPDAAGMLTKAWPALPAQTWSMQKTKPAGPSESQLALLQGCFCRNSLHH